jgi:hypothetical protein
MSVTQTTDIVSPNDVGSYVFSNDTNLLSASGSHLFYIAGSFDTLTATGGAQMVLANGGNNTIHLSGSGNNTIYMSGGNNVVDAGAGFNAITDAVGTGDRIIIPTAASGFDRITLLAGADAKLDFAAALRSTTWDGKVADLASYISVASNGAGTMISLSATAAGAGTAVASVTSPGGTHWDLSAVLAHVVT